MTIPGPGLGACCEWCQPDAWAPQRQAVLTTLADREMTQAELALKVGITQKHLSQILNGRADGSVQLWGRIAATLECDWTLTAQQEAR